MVDENATHCLRGDTEEVRPSAPVDVALIHQPEKCLVNERGCAKRVFTAFAPELRRGQDLQLVIDDRKQLVHGVWFAIGTRGQKSSDVGVGPIQVQAGRRGV